MRSRLYFVIALIYSAYRKESQSQMKRPFTNGTFLLFISCRQIGRRDSLLWPQWHEDKVVTACIELDYSSCDSVPQHLWPRGLDELTVAFWGAAGTPSVTHSGEDTPPDMGGGSSRACYMRPKPGFGDLLTALSASTLLSLLHSLWPLTLRGRLRGGCLCPPWSP